MQRDLEEEEEFEQEMKQIEVEGGAAEQ